MECHKTRERLSAYIDDFLSPQEKMAVDEHLKSCPECAAALADLKKTVEHVKSLETVEPPPWLTQKVMAKVRAEAQPRKGLFQKLFYPLYIKLPIEAVAVVLVIGLALSLYRDMPPEVKFAQAPVEKRAPQLPQREAEADKSLGMPPSLPPPVHPVDKGKSEEWKSSSAKPSELPVALGKKEAGAGKTEAAPEVKTHAEKREVPSEPSPAKEREVTPAAGVSAKGEARRGASADAPKAKLSFMEKKDEKVLSFTVLVKDRETAFRDIEKTVAKLADTVIHTESVGEKRIITSEINAAKMKELIEKLKSSGQVKEKDIDFEAMKGEVGIRIEIVSIPEGR